MDINYKTKISLFIIWMTMFMAFPFSIPQAFNLPAKAIMGIGALLLLIPLALKIKFIQINFSIAAIFLGQIIFSILFLFLHRDAAYINLCFQIIVPFIIYLYAGTIISYDILTSSMLKLMSYIGILAVVCFFLCLIINLPEYSTFENPDGRMGYNYLISLTNTVFDIGFVKIIRPAGYFDEPGTLAFYLTVAILINDLTIRRKSLRTVFMITGVFTLSIAFYIVLLLYCLLYFDKKLIVKGAFIGMISLFVFLMLYSKLGNEQQDIINSYTIGRVQGLINPKEDTNDYFKADNRSDLVDVSIDAIKDSPIIGQGLSYASLPEGKFNGKFMGANFLGTFGIHGILGGIIFSLHVFYYFIVCFRRKTWLDVPQKCCVLYLLLILQRPDYIGGILTYVSVTMLTLASLKYYTNAAKNISHYSSL